MHLSRTFEIKGSDKFSVTPWPLWSPAPADWWAVNHTPVPSTGALSSPPSALPWGQRGSGAFLINQTEKHNAFLLFSATFTGKDLSAPVPAKSQDLQTVGFTTVRWLCPGAQRWSRHCLSTGCGWKQGWRQHWREALFWVEGQTVLLSILKKSGFTQ